jgi:putative membrane protein
MALNRMLLVVMLFVLAGVLLVRTATAQMALYIHPRYEVLMYVCAVVVFAFAVAVVWDAGRLPAYIVPMLGVPVLLGVLVVPRPLGSATLLQQSATLNRVAQRGDAEFQRARTDATSDTSTWNLYDWAVASSVDPAALAGRPAVVTGFVVFPPDMDLSDQQFMLARYVITCCTADAGGVGMRVLWPESARLANDQWVEVTGTVEVVDMAGIPTAVLRARQVVPSDPPAKPYLTPDAPSSPD